MKKYSIIIPVKNGGNYIKLAIDSVLGQVYKDYDLIILYNKSSDNTLSTIKSYKDQRIKIYESEKDLSITENWGRILNIPLREYLIILGHDDILYPNFLEEIDILIEKYPDASIYQTHFNLIDKDGKIIRNCNKIKEKEKAIDFVINRANGKYDPYITGAIKSKLYKKIGGIPNFYKLLSADDALWVVLTSISYKITSSKICFAYRKHMASTSGGEIDLTKGILGLHQYLNFLIDNKEKYNIDNKIVEIINYKYNLANALYLSELGKNKESWKFLNEANKYSKNDFFLEKLKMIILLCIPLFLRRKIINYWKINLR